MRKSFQTHYLVVLGLGAAFTYRRVVGGVAKVDAARGLALPDIAVTIHRPVLPHVSAGFFD